MPLLTFTSRKCRCFSRKTRKSKPLNKKCERVHGETTRGGSMAGEGVVRSGAGYGVKEIGSFDYHRRIDYRKKYTCLRKPQIILEKVPVHLPATHLAGIKISEHILGRATEMQKYLPQRKIHCVMVTLNNNSETYSPSSLCQSPSFFTVYLAVLLGESVWNERWYSVISVEYHNRKYCFELGVFKKSLLTMLHLIYIWWSCQVILFYIFLTIMHVQVYVRHCFSVNWRLHLATTWDCVVISRCYSISLQWCQSLGHHAGRISLRQSKLARLSWCSWFAFIFLIVIFRSG